MLSRDSLPLWLEQTRPDSYSFMSFDILSLGSPEVTATFDVRGAPVLVVVCPIFPLTLAALSPGPASRTKP